MRSNRALLSTSLIVEALLCFGLVGLTALPGLILVPFWIGLLTTWDSDKVAPQDVDAPLYIVLSIGWVLFGVIGLLGVVRVLYVIIQGRPNRKWRVLTLLALCAGLVSVTSYATTIGLGNLAEEPVLLLFLFVLPIAGALHFMYLARHSLF